MGINRYADIFFFFVSVVIVGLFVLLVLQANEHDRDKAHCRFLCHPADFMFIDKQCHCRVPRGWELKP